MATGAEPRFVVREAGPIRRLLREAGELAIFAADAIRALPHALRFTSESLRQTAILVSGSLLIIAVMTSFIGMAVVNFGIYLLRVVGGTDYIGLVSAIALQVVIPMMFGYVFAAKVGGGLVAEIGVMRISEEIDALEVEGVDPMRYAVATRILAALIFTPVAALVALVAATTGAQLQAVVVWDAVSSGSFSHMNWAAQNVADQLQMLVSMITIAVAVIVVACFYGYRASGGPAGIGVAVARTLLVNLVLVHFIATFYVILFDGRNPTLAVGG